MSENFWTGAFMGALAVGAVWYLQPSKDVPSAKEVGRYQIISTKDEPNFLIDTATGDSWRWVRMESEYSKSKYGQPEVIAWIWEKTTRFDDFDAENAYIANIKELDKIVYGSGKSQSKK